MRRFSLFSAAATLLLAASWLGAQTLSPAVSAITNTSFTLSWTTTQALNSQVHFGVGGLTSSQFNWTLNPNHALTVTGLQPGTAYTVEAESSYYTSPDLFSPSFTVTTTGSAASAAAALSTPQISNVSSTGFTIAWSTAQPLNTQVHYGIGADSDIDFNWALQTQHSATLTGLQAGATYTVQVESSYFTDPDLLGPTQTVTLLGAAAAPSSSGARLFTSSGANWLYSAPTGSGLNISSMTSGMSFQVNDHAEGFDIPVQYTNGSYGCTTFTDTRYYNLTDNICVPNPSGGFAPSTGGYGANDGHLVVVDTANNNYYDFWELLVNSSGQPTSTNVGQIVSGNLAGSNGTPGTTAAEISGLAGDIMPGELNCETCLQHALSVIVPGSMNSNQVGAQGPAVKTDGSVSGAIFREGAKIRFDPSVNVDSLNASTAAKAIMLALQQYGGVITDQTSGSAIGFYSDLPTDPDLTGINLIGQHLLVYY